MKIATLFLWAALAAASASAETGAAPARKISAPEDLGPAAIDVSSYPPEYQKTYRDLFLPVFSKRGGTARAINSPVLELAPELEAAERRADPELFEDPSLAQPSRDGWKKKVEEIMRLPPCCGACPVLGLEKAKALRRFLVYDSIQRKTGAHAKEWIAFRKDLLRRFREYQASVALSETRTSAQEDVR